jgi:hypothetical protein
MAAVRSQLVAGSSYAFKMRFSNSAKSGMSNYSAEVNFTTPTPSISGSSSSGTITVSITGTTSPYFMVYRSTDGVNFSYVGYTANLDYTDDSVTSGQTLYYYVKSWNNSMSSNILTVVAQ